MKKFEKAMYRVKLRNDDKFKLKPGMEVLNGIEHEFMPIWVIGEESGIYQGEWAMQPTNNSNWLLEWPVWIASGDLEAV